MQEVGMEPKQPLYHSTPITKTTLYSPNFFFSIVRDTIYLFPNKVFIFENPQRMFQDLPLPRN
jgi:hypothetical protein